MQSTQKIQQKPISRSHLAAVLCGLMFSLSFPVNANHDINQQHDEGKMIEGYDVVAYHTMKQAKKGSKHIKADWLGGEWLFVNEEHRELFLADPAKYIPQYGGYCSSSYAAGNEHGSVDPKAWQVVDGKLYLFYGEKTSNRWDYDAAKVQSADNKWEKAKAGLLQQ